MNSITVFLTIACIAAGLALGAIGHLYIDISFVIAAVVIACRAAKGEWTIAAD